MNPYRYFIPQMGRNPIINNYQGTNILNIINKIGNNIKKFNWKGILNGVNKTLNVVNQTIPLVKEAKPMYDNIKNMVTLTKVLKKETVTNKTNNLNNYKEKNITNKINISNINKPNFFI